MLCAVLGQVNGANPSREKTGIWRGIVRLGIVNG